MSLDGCLVGGYNAKFDCNRATNGFVLFSSSSLRLTHSSGPFPPTTLLPPSPLSAAPPPLLSPLFLIHGTHPSVGGGSKALGSDVQSCSNALGRFGPAVCPSNRLLGTLDQRLGAFWTRCRVL